MDGVSFSTECTDNAIKQNAMYCGYDYDTMVNNVFAYGPDGKVFFEGDQFSRELGRWEFDGAFLASDEEEDAFVQDMR